MKDKKLLLLTSLVCLIPSVVGAFLYSQLPDLMPVQWGLNGQVSNQAPKWFAVFGLPLFFALFNIYCHNKTDRDSVERDYPLIMVLFLKWVMPALSVVCTCLSISASLGYSGAYIGIISFVGILFAVVGAILPKTKRNSLFGIRLPWTMKDDESWEKANKFSGKVFLLGGILIIGCAALGKTYIAFGIILAVVIISIAGSLRK